MIKLIKSAYKSLWDWEIFKRYWHLALGTIYGYMCCFYFQTNHMVEKYKYEAEECAQDYAVLNLALDKEGKLDSKICEYRLDALQEQLDECIGEKVEANEEEKE